MNPQTVQHSSSWVAFTYASFIGAVLMVGAGVVLMPLDIWIKGYFAMGTVMICTIAPMVPFLLIGGALVDRFQPCLLYTSDAADE